MGQSSQQACVVVFFFFLLKILSRKGILSVTVRCQRIKMWLEPCYMTCDWAPCWNDGSSSRSVILIQGYFISRLYWHLITFTLGYSDSGLFSNFCTWWFWSLLLFSGYFDVQVYTWFHPISVNMRWTWDRRNYYLQTNAYVTKTFPQTSCD